MAIKKTVKTLSALLLAGLLLEGGGYLYGLQPSDIYKHHFFYVEKKMDIEKEYGLLFKNILNNEELPKEWANNKEKEYIFTSINSPHAISRSFFTLIDELKKIPKSIIKNNISAIYFLDDIILNRISAGGTYNINQKSLYISPRSKRGHNISKKNIRDIFHHEFSSILLYNYNFDEIKWRSAFETGFLYENEKDPFYYAIYMQGNADRISSEELYSRGLLKKYAETGVENDFNTYAEVIFTEPRKMKRLIAEYPVIKRKYAVFKEFYLGIDPGFAPVFDRIDG